MKRSFLIILVIAVFGLIAAQRAFQPSVSPVKERQDDEKINLALRQVGHQVLTAIGNDTSRIPPVLQLAANEFVLRLENEFNYDTLPFIMAQVFEDYGIVEHYQVTIKNCQTDTLVLGYDKLAVEKEEIACKGREQEIGCSNINVAFDETEMTFFSGKYLIVSILMFAFLLWIQHLINKKSKVSKALNASLMELESVKLDNRLSIGNSFFDLQNQLFETNNLKKELTFREAKLLHFFMINPNRVLDREKILSNVWEDEGVIVGRSLDVFVSRLRKIIQDDSSLQIKNVHGIGYKLEQIK